MFLYIIMLLIGAANLYLYHQFPYPKHIDAFTCYDAAIVLGCPCQEDGTISPLQKKRMDIAIQLYRNKRVKTLLISGSNVQNTYIEAEVMAAYAYTKGVSKQAVLLETQARNTFENLKYAKLLCEQHQLQNILVITSPAHIRRAAFFVRKFFTRFAMTSYTQPPHFKDLAEEYFRMWNTLYYEIKLHHRK